MSSPKKYLLCSECFYDHGLKLQAQKIGIEYMGACLQCSHTSGLKLTEDAIFGLSHSFFVNGSKKRCKYGSYPIIEFNCSHSQEKFDDISNDLQKDMNLIEKSLNIRFFLYGPRFWMFGEIEPLKSLQKRNEINLIIERIKNEYPIKKIRNDSVVYRLRKNPKNRNLHSEYDSPPDTIRKNGRLESQDVPILYCGQDIETCIHECRSTVEDDLYIASLSPTKDLEILDLTAHLEEDCTEFESLDLAINFLFMAGKHSYRISRKIASAIYASGIQGIIYPSYFSTLRTGVKSIETVIGVHTRKIPQFKDRVNAGIVSNIAIFGRPILNGLVQVKSINRLVLNQARYDFDFGPVLD